MLKSFGTWSGLSARLVFCAAAAAATNASVAIGQSTPQTATYPGQQTRAIKSLSEQEVDDLLAGRGAGLAKAAELNGYPGPAHVLELREPLGLSGSQIEATQALMASHRAAARRLGRAVVEAERSLDHAFAAGAVDEGSVAALTAQVAQAHGVLRAEHLSTHLAQAALLTPAQVGRYAELRGYAAAEAAPSPTPRHLR